MAAILCGIKPGDEVILPSFTFSSTANAFVLAGASLVFVDVRPDTMNIVKQNRSCYYRENESYLPCPLCRRSMLKWIL